MIRIICNKDQYSDIKCVKIMFKAKPLFDFTKNFK